MQGCKNKFIRFIFFSIISTFCFINDFSISSAFQNDFESDDSIVVPPSFYDLRYLMNAPFSYCTEDGLNINDCNNLSLRLDGELFKNLTHFANFDALTGYASATAEITASDIPKVIANYTLPPYEAGNLLVPTAGQLSWMMNKNYLPTLKQGTAIFLRNKETNELEIGEFGEGYKVATNTSSAKLYRLVASDAPDICAGADCGYFRVPMVVTVYNNDKICNTTITNFQVNYLDQNNQRVILNGKSDASYLGPVTRIYIPYQSIDINLRASITSEVWHERKEILVTDYNLIQTYTVQSGITYRNACYLMKGSCAEHRIEFSPRCGNI